MVETEAVDAQKPAKIKVRNLTISYSEKPALRNTSFDVYENEIFGIIGPANSGKTSFLKALNRMDMFTESMKVEGEIQFNGREIREWRNVYALRRRIGVVFPLPVGLPMSIYDNVTIAPKLAGIRKKAQLDEIVERCLRRAALWDEVKDRLDSLGSLLSGGQQLKELRKEISIVLVTNLVQQARRLANRTAFFLGGECVEINDTEEMFTGEVKDTRTREYVEGRFG